MSFRDEGSRKDFFKQGSSPLTVGLDSLKADF